MPASINDKITKVGLPGSATTLASPGYSMGATSINLTSSTNWETTTAVHFDMYTTEISGNEEVEVANTRTSWKGVLSGTTISSLQLKYGTDQNYAAGTNTKVVITPSTIRENEIADHILTEHNQDGTHKITQLLDTNSNELLKFSSTASAVNEVTVTNAATGSAPQISATGGDSNVDLRLVPKGTGNVKRGATGGAIDWWEELGRQTLTSAGDTITISSFSARKYLKILVNAVSTGGTITTLIRFNNDSAANYAARNSGGGGADATAASSTSAFVGTTTSADAQFIELIGPNVSSVEKVLRFEAVGTNAAGAANVPNRTEGVIKWANTSAQITRIDVLNTGAGDFAIGSEVIVLGHD